MSVARAGQTATLLPDGTVLVAGGYSGLFPSPTASAEVFHPDTGTWSLVQSMSTERAEKTATLLKSGTVLLAGGVDAGYKELDSAEIYDPASGTWVPTPTMNFYHEDHTATRLQDGSVLIAGPSIDAELYLP